jgi:hypothetical protein
VIVVLVDMYRVLSQAESTKPLVISMQPWVALLGPLPPTIVIEQQGRPYYTISIWN